MKVKICCIASVAEAALALAPGAAALGLVSTMPSGPGAHAVLRALIPRVRLVQVIHVRGPESVDEAFEVAPRVDELLLDSGNPSATVRELGGTGRTHDWTLSREIVDQCGVPVWLAGGLNAGNVRAAIDAVRPQGLDLCSGVRVDGNLSAERLADFMRAVAG